MTVVTGISPTASPTSSTPTTSAASSEATTESDPEQAAREATARELAQAVVVKISRQLNVKLFKIGAPYQNSIMHGSQESPETTPSPPDVGIPESEQPSVPPAIDPPRRSGKGRQSRGGGGTRGRRGGNR
jgi:hypothetical protein